jgi:hypothetical protein
VVYTMACGDVDGEANVGEMSLDCLRWLWEEEAGKVE